MAQRPTDKYANVARTSVTLSGANTETFAELLTGISLGQGIGLLIDQIDYYLNQGDIEQLVATGDEIVMGWTTSDNAGSLATNRRTSIHVSKLSTGPIIGTPASAGLVIPQPFVYQFFPPLIIAAPRLFLGGDSGSLVSAIAVTSRFYFRYVGLTAQEYLELAETFVLVQ